jgi:hypothetical protein
MEAWLEARSDPEHAYAQLMTLGTRMITTAQTAQFLGMAPLAAAALLRRLAQLGMVRQLRRGKVWLGQLPTEPWAAVECVAGPQPLYVSLRTALFLHGATPEAPSMHYAVWLGSTRQIRAKVGQFSLHHVPEELFGGFEPHTSGAKVATLEKALFDLAFLSSARLQLLSPPLHLQMPRRLKANELWQWLDRIGAGPRRTQVQKRLESMLHQARAASEFRRAQEDA